MDGGYQSLKPLLAKAMEDSRFVLNLRPIWAGGISPKNRGVYPKIS
jgi:hypothetical protein